MRVTRLALVAIILTWAQIASAQTADEVIEKSIAAMGGRAAHEKIKTRLTTGELSIGTPAGDIAGTVEMYAAVPNKQRTVIKADLSPFGAGQMLIDQRFDGTTGYAMDSMQGNREITGSQLDNMKAQAFPNPFLNYKASGMSVTLGAKEKVRRSRRVSPDVRADVGIPDQDLHRRRDLYADPDDRTRRRSADGPGRADGRSVRLARRRRRQGAVQDALTNSMQSITMTFSKVENNVTIDDKMFVKP